MSLQALVGISRRRFVARLFVAPVLGRLGDTALGFPLEGEPHMVPARSRRYAGSTRTPSGCRSSSRTLLRSAAAEIEQIDDIAAALADLAREGPAAAGSGRHADQRGPGGRHHARVRSRQTGGAGRRGRCGSAALRPAGRGPCDHLAGQPWTGRGWRAWPRRRGSTGDATPASKGTSAHEVELRRSPDRRRIPPGSTRSSPRSAVAITTPPATRTHCWPSAMGRGPGRVLGEAGPPGPRKAAAAQAHHLQCPRPPREARQIRGHQVGAG